jgi:hypothetical protein
LEEAPLTLPIATQVPHPRRGARIAANVAKLPEPLLKQD